MKNELVVKSNKVIEASYRLSVIEQRVVLCAIAKIPKKFEVSDEEIYTVTVQDLQALGVNQTTAYRDLKEAANRLYERSISLDIDDRLIKMRWVQLVEFADSQGTISIRFSKDILPFISNVKANFTKYMLSEVSRMQGAYTVRIYELLTQYKSVGKRLVSIDELRFMLDLGTRYKTTGNVIAWVIAPSVSEINAQTSLNISAEPIKTGRKITHISFTIKAKSKPKQQARDPKTVDWVNGVSDDEIRGMSSSQAMLFADQLYKNPEIVGNWEGSYIDAKNKLIQLLQQPYYVRKYMHHLLQCNPPFDPKTVGFK